MPTAIVWAVVLAIVGLGLALRMHDIAAYWVNPDEGIYFWALTAEDPSVFWREVAQNAHSPRYYLLLRGLAAFSGDFVVFRWVSCLLGCVAIAGMFLATRELSGGGRAGACAGVVAALVVAVSPATIELSELMRPYMLQVAALTFAVYFLVRCLQRGTRGNIVGYASSLGIALLTHYSSLLALGAVGLFLIGMLAARRLGAGHVRTLAIAHAAPALIVAGLYWFHLRPRLIGSTLQTESLGSWLMPFTVQKPADAWLQIYSFFYFLLHEFAGVGVLLLVAGVAVGIYHRRPLVFGPPLAALALAIVAAAAAKYPFGCSRHSIYLIVFLLPPAAWLVGRGLAAGVRVCGATLAVLCLLALLRLHIAALVGGDQAYVGLFRERVLSVAERGEMEPVLRTIRDTPDVVLMSKQAFYFLIPLYREESERAVWSADRKFFRFRWGRSDVLVGDVWEFRADLAGLDDDSHLMQTVEAVDRALPEVRLSSREEVWILFGGWSRRTPLTILQNERNLPPSSQLLAYSKDLPGMHAFRFRLARFVDGVRSAKSVPPTMSKRLPGAEQELYVARRLDRGDDGFEWVLEDNLCG